MAISVIAEREDGTATR